MLHQRAGALAVAAAVSAAALISRCVGPDAGGLPPLAAKAMPAAATNSIRINTTFSISVLSLSVSQPHDLIDPAIIGSGYVKGLLTTFKDGPYPRRNSPLVQYVVTRFCGVCGTSTCAFHINEDAGANAFRL